MKWLIVVCIALFLCSCASLPLMHYSVAQNAPLLTHKNETQFSVASGTETIGFQGAYAFSKSFAAMGSFSDGLDDYSGQNSDVNYGVGNRWNCEFAVGYFKMLDESTILEVYGGSERYYRNFTVGSHNAMQWQTDVFHTNCTKPFVQLDLGSRVTEKHNFSVSIKFGYFIYDNFYFYYDYRPLINNSYTKNHANISPTTEPCVTYRTSWNKLSFQVQFGLSTQNPVSVYDTNGDLYFNMGLSLRLFGEQKTK